ncbi:GTPase IMAP family member 7-like [Physella acuta]|uniref:GTPase IMAP family member 7-like n=1 Tax=Physella acuta TaxID=109671 RepID=UPI0027DBA392|nr:GTPase IMAP family member 7-like [Physella acuta]
MGEQLKHEDKVESTLSLCNSDTVKNSSTVTQSCDIIATTAAVPSTDSGVKLQMGEQLKHEDKVESTLSLCNSSTVEKLDKITLALVGKVGNGKSSSANSILGQNLFESSNSASSCTYLTTAKHVIHGHYEIKVVDTPGVMDLDDKQEIANLASQLPGMMSVCPKGVHAMLLVLHFGTRYTKEDRQAVSYIKQIFGETIFRDHGIIIMTHGEDFDMDNNDEDTTPITFETWCKNQKGPIEELFKECDNRIVLFYNRNKKKKPDAVKQLLNIAFEIGKKGAYCNEQFLKCAEERNRLILKYKLPELNLEFQRKVGYLMKEINYCSKSKSMTEMQLVNLKTQCTSLFDEMNKISQDPNIMKNLKDNVVTIERLLKEINLKDPIEKQIKPIENILDKIFNPPMSVDIGAAIAGCVLLASGAAVTVLTGGAAPAAAIIAAEVFSWTGAVGTGISFGKLLGKLIIKLQNR